MVKKMITKPVVKYMCVFLAVLAVMFAWKDRFISSGGVYYPGFFLVFGALLFIVGAGCIFAWDRKMGIEKLFAAIAIAAGIGMALVNPLGQEPDGWAHFIRAMDVSYGNVLAPYTNIAHEDGYNIVPENINDIHFEIIDPGAGEGDAYLEHLMNTGFSKETVLMEGENAYTSLFYMPQALGTLIGRTLNLSIYACMVLGRIVNLLCYVALAYWALKLMPVYKTLFAVIAMLPMTIYQAASYSPDALLNGLCFLFTALCFYFAFGEKEKLSWKNAIVLGVLLVIIFTCKYVYVCLGLLVFLIPMKKFGSRTNYWKSFGIALLPVVAVLVFYAVMLGMNTPAAAESEAAAGAAETVAMTQFDYVREQPLAVLKVFVHTIENYFNLYVHGLNTLGWMNYSLDILKTIVPCFMVIIACLDTEGEQQKIKIHHKILCFFTGVLTVAVSMMGLYLMDTNANPVGAELILGYQSRYAIPCMVLLLAVFTSEKVTNRIKGFSVKVLGCMGVFLAYSIMTLVQICY